MKTKLWVIISIVVLFTAILGLWLVENSRQHDLHMQTISILDATYVGIVNLEKLHKKPILELINSPEPSQPIGINRRLAILFEENDFYIASKAKPLTPLYLLDAYGNPLTCLSREEAIRQKLPPGLIGRSRSVVIYSIGANGKDEGGHGDDVYWEEP
jgi:hypothetical protein